MTTLVVAKYQPIGPRSAVSGISRQPMNGQQWHGSLCDHEIPLSASPWPLTAVNQSNASLLIAHSFLFICQEKIIAMLFGLYSNTIQQS
jgi:hypothetical protein